MKYILFAVLGTTPQVLTEALYALHKSDKKINAIEIITTQTGYDYINAMLLANGDGAYYCYLKDYNISKDQIEFSKENITILKYPNGKSINDITSLTENQILMFTVLKKACELTASVDTTVYFLIAGGRKTMSSCLSLAAQLYGRPYDRIYHVLVSPDFENCRNFFYPPPKSKSIELLDSKGQPFIKETRYADIELINMPFVSIREHLPVELLNNLKDIKQLMPYLIMDKPHHLKLILATCQIIYGNKSIKLIPAYMAFYAFFVQKKLKCNQLDNCDECNDCFMDIQEIMDANEEIVSLYKQIIQLQNRYVDEDKKGIYALTKEDIRIYKAKINESLRRAFGHNYSSRLCITSVGEKPNTKYGITLGKDFLILQ